MEVSDFCIKSETFYIYWILIIIIAIHWKKYVETMQFFFGYVGKLIQNDRNIILFGIAENIDDICELGDYVLHAHDIDFCSFGIFC